LLSALVHSPPQLEILRLLTGFGLGGAVLLAIVIAADFGPRHSRGRFVILIQAAVPMGQVFGGLLASQFVRAYGWPAIFIAGGVLPIAVAPLLMLLPNAAAERRDESRKNPVAALFRDGLAPTTLLLWSMSLLCMLVIHFITLWIPAILHSMGESPARSILAASMYSLGGLAGPFITAPFVDKVGIERVLSCALALGAFCVLAIGASSVLLAALRRHLRRWDGRQLHGGNHHPVLPGLSHWDTLNRRKLGGGRGTYRQHRGPVIGRSIARVQFAAAEHFRCRLHTGTMRSAVDGNLGAVAAQTRPHSMIRNSSKSGRDSAR
jgi:hypothetical protein